MCGLQRTADDVEESEREREKERCKTFDMSTETKEEIERGRVVAAHNFRIFCVLNLKHGT
jgi:hypothetical protein